MDTLEVDAPDFARCLADLETVNRLSRATAPTLGFLGRLTRGWPKGSELRVLDAGSGEGAMLRTIHRWAAARGLVPRLTGVDLNPHATAAARAQTPPGLDIAFVTGDILAAETGARPHAVTSALFAHHLDDATLGAFLAFMERTASRGWFVNDLHRHPVAWYGFRAIAGVAGWHRFVQHDGPVSIARAFVTDDWRRLLAASGIDGAEIRWHFPFRLCVSRLKPEVRA
jgi:SAM-dependent methyltransferase